MCVRCHLLKDVVQAAAWLKQALHERTFPTVPIFKPSSLLTWCEVQLQLGGKSGIWKSNVSLLLQIHTLYLPVSLVCCLFHQNSLTMNSLHMGNDSNAPSLLEKYGQQSCIALVKMPFLSVFWRHSWAGEVLLTWLVWLRHLWGKTWVARHLWAVDPSLGFGEHSFSASPWYPVQGRRCKPDRGEELRVSC